MSRVVEWDGKHVPEEMRTLPPGRYVVEAIDPATALTEEEEAGLEEAIRAFDAGDPGVSLEDVRADLDAVLKK